ncbi:hypothetical protein ABIA52_003745 [Paenarthrobacter histidinolovorans]|uniref:Uncharacterized protein n=1 Tax=Paenarthrobacter histidinolovorans TaxID=43664 RepID=A0ABW8NB88_9MICC
MRSGLSVNAGPQRLLGYASANPDFAVHGAVVITGHQEVGPSFALL